MTVTARVEALVGAGLATVMAPSPAPRTNWGLHSSLTDADLAIGGTSSRDILVVTSLGAAFHYDGSRLRPLETGIENAELTDIWMASSSEAFAVGRYPGTWEGRAFRYDGTSWREMALPADANHLSAVWGTAPDNVWAVSAASDIIHFNGSTWTTHVDFLDNTVGFADVWGSSANDVYAVLSYNVLHYDGEEWTVVEQVSDGVFHAVWGTAPDDVYAAGELFSGVTLLLHYDGVEWSRVEEVSGLPGRFETVGGSGPKDVFIAGRQGALRQGATAFHYDGSTWSPLSGVVAEGYQFSDVFSPATGRVFLAGRNGALVGAAGTEVSLVHHEGTPRLHGVWGSSDANVFAVGSNGRILHFSGSAWNEMASGTESDLLDVWGTGPGNVFAAGAEGTILRFDGASWVPLPSPRDELVRAVWGLSENHIVAAVDEGPQHESPHFMHYDGREWTRSEILLSESIVDMLIGVYAFWGFGRDDIYAVGQADLLADCRDCGWSGGAAVFHYDGSAWRLAWSGDHDTSLRDVWGTSPDDLWAVGWSGGGSGPFAVHFDGDEWTTVDLPLPPEANDRLFGVWGTGPQDVYAAGSEGLLLHYDGQQWTQLETGSANSIRAIWGTAGGPAWAVSGAVHSPGGSILQGRPD